MTYYKTTLNEIITINDIYTIHYFEYDKDFKFDPEKHDFWEFIYVDNGNVNICMDDLELTLKTNEIAFHKPNELHRVEADHKSSLDLIVVSFSSDSKAMDFFKEKKLNLDNNEREILNKIIVEARHLFSTNLSDPYIKGLEKNIDCLIGSEQLIKIYLEEFLINLLRRNSYNISSNKKEKISDDKLILNKIIAYLNANLSYKLTIKQICDDNFITRARLQKIFHDNLHTTAIDYFINLKIKEVKRLIRSGNMNFSQIANKLGYSSIHYLSKQFKDVTKLSLTSYATSIKALNDKYEE